MKIPRNVPGNDDFINTKVRAFCMDIVIRSKGKTESEFNRIFDEFIKNKACKKVIDKMEI